STDRSLDGPFIDHALHGFLVQRADMHDVGRWHLADLRVVLTDSLRIGTVVVDDEEDVLTRLRGRVGWMHQETGNCQGGAPQHARQASLVLHVDTYSCERT